MPTYRVKSYILLLISAFIVLCAGFNARFSFANDSNSVASDVLRLKASPIKFQNISGWSEDSHLTALRSLAKSCKSQKYPKITRKMVDILNASEISYEYDELEYRQKWQGLCDEVIVLANPARKTANIQILEGGAKRLFEDHFQAFSLSYRDAANDDNHQPKVKGGNKNGLFTGYYIPLLSGSFEKSDKYKYPVYALPDELKSQAKSVAWGGEKYRRVEIDAGSLAGRGLELLWLDDEVMRFFAHIQGSALVQINSSDPKLNGKITKIAYAGKSGHEYFSIGREVIAQGWMTREEMSMPNLRQWLYDNSDKARAVMQKNPSYIFFALDSKTYDHAVQIEIKGAAGVPLSAQRSLAVDPSYFSYGTPLFLTTQVPSAEGFSNQGSNNGKCYQSWQKLMVAQDTGSAIKGPIRGDIYFGIGGMGSRPEFLAGNMNSRGELVMFVLR